MLNWTNDKIKLCPQIVESVSLNQTSEDCRKKQGCTQCTCPLEADFSPDPIDIRTARLKIQTSWL